MADNIPNHKSRKYLDYGALAAAVIMGVALRILAAEKMGWLADDVFHVVYINEWFLEHFRDYFFQWQHTNYPPMSPYFGNPPLSMWLMTFGMYLAKSAGASLLMGARLVNVFFASLTIILTYLIGRKWLSGHPAAIIASIALALSPALIAGDSSAYLDTVLSFFLMADVYLLFSYLDAEDEKSKMRLSVMLGISLGMSLLAKLYIIPIIGLIFLLFLSRYLSNGKDKTNYLLVAALTVLVPPILWAGARDLNHLQHVFGFVSTMRNGNFAGMFADYLGVPGVGTEGALYYFSILWGRLPPLLSIFFVSAIIYAIYKLYREIELGKIEPYTIRFLFLALSAILPILFVYFFGGMIRTTLHRTIFIVPLIALLASDTLVAVYSATVKKHIKNENLAYVPLYLLAVVSFAYPLSGISPEYYNAYNNFLVGGIQGGSGLYHVGDGDGMEQVGKWVMENTPPGTNIGVYNFAPTLQQYVENRTITGIPLNRGVDYAISKGARYLVIHNYINSGSTRLAHNFSMLDKAFTVYVQGYPYIVVYDIAPSKWYVVDEKIQLNETNWWIQSLSGNSSMQVDNQNGIYYITYNVSGNDWAFALTTPEPLPDERYSGVYLEIYGDNNTENFFLDFPAPSGAGYFRNSVNVGWIGYKPFYFFFNESRKYGNISVLNVTYLKFSVDSSTPKNGMLVVRNLSYFKRNETSGSIGDRPGTPESKAHGAGWIISLCILIISLAYLAYELGKSKKSGKWSTDWRPVAGNHEPLMHLPPNRVYYHRHRLDYSPVTVLYRKAANKFSDLSGLILDKFYAIACRMKELISARKLYHYRRRVEVNYEN